MSAPPASGPSRRWVLLCVAAGLALAALALAGAGRQWAYDEAVSFGYFVATPSPLDVFGRTAYLGVPIAVIATNNHPLFNFLEHLLYSAGAGRSEWPYRVLPALCGGGCVALLGIVARPRLGRAGAAAAMLVLAANPLFDDESHVMRGYTLLLLLVLLAAIALHRRQGLLYAAAVALGLATHLYLLLALPGLLVLAWRRRRLRWAGAWSAAGVALGATAYAGLAGALLEHTRHQGRLFRPDFLLQLGLYLLGAPWLWVVALTTPLVLLGLVAARRDPLLWALAAAYALLSVAVWQARPAELYPRFFFFLLPAVAWLAGAAVRRWPLLLALAGAVAAVSVGLQAPGWTQDQLAARSAAAVLERRPGGCALSHDELVLAAYTRAYRVVEDPAQLAGCDYLVVVTWELVPALAEAAAGQFPERRPLPAAYPGLVLSR